MKEMLQELIERDFTAYKMQKVIDAIANVEMSYKLIRLHRNRGDLDMIQYDKRDLRIDMEDLRKKLETYSLKYSIEDLIDDGGVEL